MNRSHLFVLLFIWLVGIFIGWNIESIFPTLSDASKLDSPLEMKPMFGMQPNVLGLFTNNLLVGLIIVLSGWLSAGSLSCIISFWNACILGVLINSALAMGISYTVIVDKIIWHGSLEIIALILYGAIGLQGFCFMQAILNAKSVDIQIKKILGYLALATITLLIAAFIEVSVI